MKTTQLRGRRGQCKTPSITTTRSILPVSGSPQLIASAALPHPAGWDSGPTAAQSTPVITFKPLPLKHLRVLLPCLYQNLRVTQAGGPSIFQILVVGVLSLSKTRSFHSDYGFKKALSHCTATGTVMLHSSAHFSSRHTARLLQLKRPLGPTSFQGNR